MALKVVKATLNSLFVEIASHKSMACSAPRKKGLSSCAQVQGGSTERVESASRTRGERVRGTDLRRLRLLHLPLVTCAACCNPGRPRQARPAPSGTPHVAPTSQGLQSRAMPCSSSQHTTCRLPEGKLLQGRRRHSCRFGGWCSQLSRKSPGLDADVR